MSTEPEYRPGLEDVPAATSAVSFLDGFAGVNRRAHGVGQIDRCGECIVASRAEQEDAMRAAAVSLLMVILSFVKPLKK